MVEMLVSVSIIAMIGIVLYSVVSSGIDIWVRAYQVQPEDDLGIFFARFRSDLKNSFTFSGLEFAGERQRLMFPALVFDQGGQRTVGKISYLYRDTNNLLNREQYTYSRLYTGGMPYSRVILDDISFLEFSYYFFDEESQEYLWLESWNEDELPLAVRVRLEYNGGKNAIQRTFSIPRANL